MIKDNNLLKKQKTDVLQTIMAKAGSLSKLALKGLSIAASLPAQVVVMTLAPTKANADEVNMKLEDFAKLAEEAQPKEEKEMMAAGGNVPSTDIKDYWRRSWGIGDRQPFAEAGLADPANNIVKGQDLGTGIQQRLKFGQIKYITSAVEDTILHEHKNYKEAKAFRKNLIKKYAIGEPKAYRGKYNYKELIKDKAFEKFWKAKVDAINAKGADSILQGIGTREALQKVINEHNLKPNDYEGIFNKVLEETRITEAVRKGKGKPGQKRLVSAQILSNLMRTFEDAYNRNGSTVVVEWGDFYSEK